MHSGSESNILNKFTLADDDFSNYTSGPSIVTNNKTLLMFS